MAPPRPRKDRAKQAIRRSAARLAAVQALYQIDVTDATVERVLEEFVRFRLEGRGPVDEDVPSGETDRTLFLKIVRGVGANGTELDEIIGGCLTKDWSLERMDRVLLAILRAGCFELYAIADIPPRVVISQYVDVANAFFDGKEPGFVNGLLDRVARTLRPDEMQDRLPRDAAAKP
jgi:N utilization substance protein B